MIIKLLILLAVVVTAVYLIYINGFGTFGNKKALFFLSKYSFSNKCCSASFKACTGYTKRVMIFKEPHTCTFNLNCLIESGEIKAVIQNKDKTDLIVLTPENPAKTLDIISGRYYLTVEFYKAYGSYNLTWK